MLLTPSYNFSMLKSYKTLKSKYIPPLQVLTQLPCCISLSGSLQTLMIVVRSVTTFYTPTLISKTTLSCHLYPIDS